MPHEAVSRRLAALMAGDIAGYSRIMAGDEAGTFARVKTIMEDLIAPAVARHRGRLIRTMGDGFLAEFASALDSVACGLDIQRAMAEWNQDAGPAGRLEFRIGINLGDVIADGADVYGDGVNIAARLEALAEAGQVYVSGKIRDETAGKVAAGFRDLGEKWLKNIPEPVRVFAVEPGTQDSARVPRTDQAERPSIAVLPFNNFSGDPDQEYFADGITEDIISSLSLVRWLSVIARNSTFVYKGKAIDIRRVGQELGVRYVLEGSVRKAGERVRITAQLIESSSGRHIWSVRYDEKLADIFDVQDRLTTRIVASIKPHLAQAETERSRKKRPDSLGSWDLYLRATHLYYETSQAANEQAAALLNEAVKLDSNFASAYARWAACKIQAAYQGWAPSARTTVCEALALAQRATQLDPAEPLGFDALASAYVYLGDNEEGLRAAQRALEIDPGLSAAQGTLISALALLGRADEAVRVYEASEQSNPMDPDRSGRLMGLVIAHFSAKRYDQAAIAAREHRLLRPKWYGSRVFLAASLVRLGRVEEASQAARELLALVPRFNLTRARNRPMFSNREIVDDLVAALKIAGVAEQ